MILHYSSTIINMLFLFYGTSPNPWNVNRDEYSVKLGNMRGIIQAEWFKSQIKLIPACANGLAVTAPPFKYSSSQQQTNRYLITIFNQQSRERSECNNQYVVLMKIVLECIQWITDNRTSCRWATAVIAFPSLVSWFEPLTLLSLRL